MFSSHGSMDGEKPTWKQECEIARLTVAAACRICRAVQSDLVSTDTLAKHDRSPVTVADFAAQAIILHRLGQAFPEIPAVAEETADALRGEDAAALRKKITEHVRREADGLSETGILDAIDLGRYAGGATGSHWVLDPIDGTKGFLRGEQYAIALGLIHDGQVVLGVLGCPNLPSEGTDPTSEAGCIFIASRGTGTTQWDLNMSGSRQVQVSTRSDPAEARFCESVEKAHTRQDQSAQVVATLGTQAPPVRMDSQCKYAAVARGNCEIYLRLPTRPGYQECIWDHAAGFAIITEAGGQVTDVNGNPLDFSIGRKLSSNSGIVATNGLLHAQTLDAVGQVIGA